MKLYGFIDKEIMAAIYKACYSCTTAFLLIHINEHAQKNHKEEISCAPDQLPGHDALARLMVEIVIETIKKN